MKLCIVIRVFSFILIELGQFDGHPDEARFGVPVFTVSVGCEGETVTNYWYWVDMCDTVITLAINWNHVHQSAVLQTEFVVCYITKPADVIRCSCNICY